MALGREHCLPLSLELWTFEAKGGGAWEGLECIWVHDALSEGVPKNVLHFTGDGSVLVACTHWHHGAHPGHGLFYFTSHAVSWPSAWGPRWTHSLGGALCVVRAGWGQLFLETKLSHSECGFPSHGFSERSSRAPMPKEGNRISQPLLGIGCRRGSLHFLGPRGDWMPVGLLAFPRPPWHSRMERSPPSTTNLQRLGWFSKGHTRGRPFVWFDGMTQPFSWPLSPSIHTHVLPSSRSFTLTPLSEMTGLCFRTPCTIPQLFLMRDKNSRAFIGSFQSKSCTQKKTNRLNAVFLALFTDCFRDICLK